MKPSQTRWLSLSQCVKRIISQWPALEVLFTAEVFETKSSQAEKIQLHLRSHYIKATFEFVDFVLADLTVLNALFQSNKFKLHRLLPEIEHVVRMFCTSFLRTINDDLKKVDVDKIDNWLPLNSIYPGILAHETVKAMVPHEKGSFPSRCRNWYREAVRQILNRIDLTDPVLKALQSIHPAFITDKKAAMGAAGTLASKLPRLAQSNIQTIDRQWRSLLLDLSILNGGLKDSNTISFWQSKSNIEAILVSS